MPTATAAQSGQNVTYQYKARAANGKLVKGTIAAANEQAAGAKLVGQRLVPIDVTEKGTGLSREITIPGFQKRVKVGELAVATRQLSTMTASGLPLLRALTVVGDQTANPRLRAVLQEVAKEVETGKSFSDCLAKHPDEIPPIMVSMLRAGETGGFLDSALDSTAATFEKEAKLRSTIKSAMTYPVAVLCIALLAVVGMLLFIVPIFKKMFEGLGSQLPAATQLLVDISDQMWWLTPSALVLIVGVSIWWRKNRRKPAVRRIVEPLSMKVPIFGPLMAKVAISRFTRNLGNMTTAGVPLMRALSIVGPTSGNWIIERTAEKMAESVRVGGSMVTPLEEEPLFPQMAVQMIAVGEESGAIDSMLVKVADSFDSQIEATADALTSLIEPVLICFLGVVVGGMVIALYMPIFSIATAVQGK